MEAIAKLKYARIAPRKSRLVADLIRGQKVEKAKIDLEYLPKRGAKIIAKLLDSAIANAVELGIGDPDELYISRIFVDQGPVQKSYMPRAMGRAGEIKKRMSHITIALSAKTAGI